MTTTIQNVIVAGATGYVGQRVVAALKANGFKVSILTRATGTQNGTHSAGHIVTDYSEASLKEALKGHDAVVSTVGAAGIMQQTKLIDAAIAVGIKRFIPSDYAPNTFDLSAMEKIVPPLYERLKPRHHILNYLKEKAKASPEFSWTSIGSGPLIDWSLMTGAQGMSIDRKTAIITDSGNELYPITTVAQVARAIVHVLKHPEETASRYFMVRSLITSQNQLLHALEKETKATWNVQRMTSEQRHKDGVRLLSEGNFAGLGNMWNVWFNTDGRGTDASEEAYGNADLHLPDEGIEEVISKIVAS